MNKDILIEKIKSNKHYLNNEDLLDLFIDSVYEKLVDYYDSISDTEILERYVNKLVSKSMIEVLKRNNRYNYNKSLKSTRVNFKKFNYDNSKYNVPQYSIRQLKQLYTMIQSMSEIDECNKSNYLDVIMLRYKEKQTLFELQEKLNLSNSEIVEMLFKLSDSANKVIQQ